jgi:membrane-associated phospholipid phosphatase
MNEILLLDRTLFRFINSTIQNDLFDLTLPFVRNSIFWVPLYLFLLLFALMNFRKNSWWWVLFAVATAGLTDFVSSDLIKENIFRLRPCHDPEFARLLVGYCPMSSGFTSSHATNHFGLAAFFYVTLREIPLFWRKMFFAWAGIIVFAQVYVGVHYPLDVICGGLVGIVFGYLNAKAFNRIFGLA